MQNNKVLVILIVVMIIILVGVFGISIFKEVELNNGDTNNKTNNVENEISDIEVLEVSSKDVVNLVAPFNIISMLDDESLLTLFFGEKDSVKVTSLTDSQKFYLALRHYMITNEKSNLSMNTCGEGDFYNLSKNELKKSFFKDSSYLSNINSLKQIRVGEYTYYVQSNNLMLCGSIFGFVGPLRNDTELEIVSAYKKNDKLYINVKFIHYVLDNNKSTDQVFYYNTYDVYTDGGKVIESFNEGLEQSFVPDYSKYSTYELVFEIDDDNYYFESINRKK